MPSAEKANRRYFRRAYGSGVHGWAADDPSPHAVAFLQRLARLLPGVQKYLEGKEVVKKIYVYGLYNFVVK